MGKLEKRSIKEPIIETLEITEEEESWMKPYILQLKKGILPTNENEARKIRINATFYNVYEDRLYRKGYSTPLVKMYQKKRGRTCHQENTFRHMWRIYRIKSNHSENTSNRVFLAIDGHVTIMQLNQLTHNRNNS